MNEKKTDQLGIPYGTASHKLRKALMFSMAKELKKDICLHCKVAIENIDEFSIDHIVPWLDSNNPKELFYDLSNIAFSHIKCNISKARKPLKKYFTLHDRLEATKKLNRDAHRRNYCSKKRALKFKNKGY